MFRFSVLFSALCVLKHINAACISQPLVLATPNCNCLFSDIPSGVVSCDSCQCSNKCGNACANYANSLCSCGAPACSCFRDTSAICNACEAPSPVCSCLSSLGEDCSCGKNFVYFPEVAYPNTILEMNPFYFSTCFSY